jgi:DNA-binding NarL/FixJ family response regulator
MSRKLGGKMGSLRIVVADDHDVVRRGLRDLLERQPGWEVVAEAKDGAEAVKKVIEMDPDVTILDISMPSINGLEAARQIAKSGSKTRVVVLTIYDSDDFIREMLHAGVRGCVLKSDAVRELIAAVEAVSHNKTFFTSKIAEMVPDGYLKKPCGTESTSARLTPRQSELLRLFAEGKTSGQAAAALGLSTKTVETHRTNIMQRLNCHSIGELVRYALRNGIIKP